MLRAGLEQDLAHWRDRATAAEAERDELRVLNKRNADIDRASREQHYELLAAATDRATKAEAEVARLREDLRLASIDVGINKAEAEARTSEAATLSNEVARLWDLWNAEVEHANRWARRAREAEAERGH